MDLRLQVKAKTTGDAEIVFDATYTENGTKHFYKSFNYWYEESPFEWKTITIEDYKVPSSGELTIYLNFGHNTPSGYSNFDLDCLTYNIFIQDTSITTRNGFLLAGSTFTDCIQDGYSDTQWYKIWDQQTAEFYTQGASNTDGNWVSGDSLSQMELPYAVNKFYVISWGPENGQSEWIDFVVSIGNTNSKILTSTPSSTKIYLRSHESKSL